MLVNTLAYIPYLAAIIWPTWYWLGIGTMFFNLFQFLGHAFKMNFGMKTWYNPGLATVIVLMMPISIAYWVHIWPIVGGWSWGLGIIALVVMLIVTVILPVQLLKSRTTDAVIPERQIRQFNWVKKAAAIRRN
ncbi:hypothetical protein FD25_GL002374 [Levilactobacillus acidifarinae DSM 19394]|uniref:Uncharacterized protein n=2 Tax=Levilactobacillus acidifarinae TaxID=267364 RepID=A0A0R1LU50_9LACO|nr:hypothetical protein FD25_GL002374 [Levilactobacillus acidifarinae DSM 19394]